MADDALVCPGCGRAHPPDERFCRACGMPLVHAGVDRGVDLPVTEAHARARKVRPQFSEGPLVAVARGRNQAEAEFLQGLLLEEGVPSMLRRSRGFDVPDMLAAGPRDVLVPQSGAAAAGEVLLQAGMADAEGARGPDRPLRVALTLLAMLVVVALVAVVGAELLG